MSVLRFAFPLTFLLFLSGIASAVTEAETAPVHARIHRIGVENHEETLLKRREDAKPGIYGESFIEFYYGPFAGNQFIDGHRVTFTSIWLGVCHHRHCSVSSGYLAANPMQGIVVVDDPFHYSVPQMLYAPNANGPLVIRAWDDTANELKLESVQDIYPIDERKMNDHSPAPMDMGSSVDGVKQHRFDSAVKTVSTPGGGTYVFDLFKAKLK